MNLINKLNSKKFILKGFFKDDKRSDKNILTSQFSITEYVDKKIAYICLGEKKTYDLSILKLAINKIVKLNTRDFDIDVDSFVLKDINLPLVIKKFVEINEYINGDGLYSAKTSKEESKCKLSIFSTNLDSKKIIDETLIYSKLVNNARRLQATPPNICNSEWLADDIKNLFSNVKSEKFSIQVLNKKQIEKEKMGLFLSVNKGSAYEPRLVVIEYKGNPSSKEKIALIGKGITFDSGGYNLKGTQHIQGMKFDMSGAAICASAMRGIIEFKPKINVCAVLPLTDNKISSLAQTPDSIWESMSGKTVEVNNTDAEGRLILADAITYAIKKCSATQIIDVATLTGAIIVSLGTTYTGTWCTNDKLWNNIEKASQEQDELLWRMPFHNDFLTNIKSSKFADYKNTDFSGKGGSNSAAMFLKEFVEDKDYIHLDIAGTGGTGDNPTGVMTKTLIQYVINQSKK